MNEQYELPLGTNWDNKRISLDNLRIRREKLYSEYLKEIDKKIKNLHNEVISTCPHTKTKKTSMHYPSHGYDDYRYGYTRYSDKCEYCQKEMNVYTVDGWYNIDYYDDNGNIIKKERNRQR